MVNWTPKITCVQLRPVAGFVSAMLNAVGVVVPRTAVTGRFELTVGFPWTEYATEVEVLEAYFVSPENAAVSCCVGFAGSASVVNVALPPLSVAVPINVGPLLNVT